jgi:anti-sigma factor RsiW
VNELHDERIRGLRLLRRTVLTLVLAIVVLAGVIAWSASRSREARSESCKAMHTLVVTLDRIVRNGREGLRAYLADGTITRAQYERELARSRQATRQLGSADCPPR